MLRNFKPLSIAHRTSDAFRVLPLLFTNRGSKPHERRAETKVDVRRSYSCMAEVHKVRNAKRLVLDFKTQRPKAVQRNQGTLGAFRHPYLASK